MIKLDYVDGEPKVVAGLNGRHGIYLDNFAIIGLAKGPAARRERFLKALHQKASLLFSLTNAAEIGGPQGTSAVAVADFLRAVGTYWVPLEINPFAVSEREERGLWAEGPVSQSFIKAFVIKRLDGYAGTAIIHGETLFDLAAIVPWSREIRDDIVPDAAEMDRVLREGIALLSNAGPTPALAAAAKLPAVAFHPHRRITFVINRLFRILVSEGKSHHIKVGDGFDFCHAAMAAAFANLATLDKAWKRRVGLLPKDAPVARVFYEPELDEFVDAVVDLGPVT